MLRFRDEAFVRYYTNPGYLGMIERRFGRQVVGHLRQMVGIPLERDLLSGKMQVPLTTLPPEKPGPEDQRVALSIPSADR